MPRTSGPVKGSKKERKTTVKTKSVTVLPGKKAPPTIKVDRQFTTPGSKPKPRPTGGAPKKRVSSGSTPTKRTPRKPTPAKTTRVKYEVKGLGTKGITVKSKSGLQPKVSKVSTPKTKTFSKKPTGGAKFKVSKPTKHKGGSIHKNKTRKCPR